MISGIIGAGWVENCLTETTTTAQVGRSEHRSTTRARALSPSRWRKRIAALTTVALLTINGTFALAEPPRSPPSGRAEPSALQSYVTEAAQRFAISATWITSVMQIESAGRAQAVSPKGARGLMQIMPRTWDELRFRYALGADPFDARDNIIAGAAYLRELLDRYGAPAFLAAYNAGPRRYEDHVTTGRALPPETIAYVGAAVRLLNGSEPLVAGGAATSLRSWSAAGLFPRRASSSPTHREGASNLPVPALSPSVGIDVTSALAPHSDGLFARIDPRNDEP